MPEATCARAAYIAGLRQVADMLDANPAVPLPYGSGTGTHPAQRLRWFFHNLSAFGAFVGACPSMLVRDGAESDRSSDYPHVFVGDIAGLHVIAYCAATLDEHTPEQAVRCRCAGRRRRSGVRTVTNALGDAPSTVAFTGAQRLTARVRRLDR